MKRLIWILTTTLVLAFAAGSPAVAQLAAVSTPAAVSYLNPGRYLIVQGSYVNDKGNAETSLVKFDTQTGLAWLLRPVPADDAPSGTDYRWVPVKN